MSNQPPRRTLPRTRRAAAALRYAALGWPVLPLHTPQPDDTCSCADTACPKRGKHPRNRHRLRDVSTDARRVAVWWHAWPHANIGVATGRLVIDVDGDAGHAALAELGRRYH